MTSPRRILPPRVFRLRKSGDLFDGDQSAVTIDFVADLVWLGHNVCVLDEATGEDQTEEVLARPIFSRLRGEIGTPLTAEGVALARAIVAVLDVRGEFERVHERLARLERLVESLAESPNVSGPQGK